MFLFLSLYSSLSFSLTFFPVGNCETISPNPLKRNFLYLLTISHREENCIGRERKREICGRIPPPSYCRNPTATGRGV